MWCLGKKYATPYRPHESSNPALEAEGEESALDMLDSHQDGKEIKLTATNGTSSAKSGARSRDSEADKGWPSDFLDDCESRLWFTYRSNFTAINRSLDAPMTLSLRLRSLGDQGGFTSDTGWGCMIRSGQSLLANALVLLRLGRGEWSDCDTTRSN